MATILIADDEAKIVQLVSSYLEASGFHTAVASDGTSALSVARARMPDCAVLDINMPGMDGLELSRELRKIDPGLPIILLTARGDETDRVVGLELGADDYIVKPFSPRELVARVKAVLRRSRMQEGEPSILRSGEVTLDMNKRTVTVSGERKELTAVQFSVLALLVREPGRVFSRTAILDSAIGSAFDGYERTIDAHIKNIRKALGDVSDEPRFIGTVRGVGYKFMEDSR